MGNKNTIYEYPLDITIEETKEWNDLIYKIEKQNDAPLIMSSVPKRNKKEFVNLICNIFPNCVIRVFGKTNCHDNIIWNWEIAVPLEDESMYNDVIYLYVYNESQTKKLFENQMSLCEWLKYKIKQIM